MPAAIYCRISRDRTGAGLGVERQEQDCRALADRLKLTVATVLVDNDLSAYSGKKRPSYERLLEGVRAGTYTAVLAWHPDRLHRSPAELERFIDVVEAARVQVHTVTAGDVDLTTASGRMTARIVGAVARHESEHRGERIRRKHLQLAENGLPSGGLRAFGYQPDGMTVREDEAELVRELCSRFLAGDSIHSLVVDLNRRGVPTVRGGPWNNQIVRQIIGRPRNAGLRIRYGQVFSEGQWPAIVAKDVWAACRAKLDDPTRRVSFSNARVHLLSGIAVCGVCGQKMRGTSRATGQLIYKCRQSCLSRDLRSVDALVVGAVKTLLSSPTAAKIMRPRVQRGPDHAAEIIALRERQKITADMFADGSINRSTFQQINERLDQTIAQHLARMAADSPHVAVDLIGDAEYVTKRWENLPLDRRRVVIDALMSVTIMPTRKGSPFRPESVRLQPR